MILSTKSKYQEVLPMGNSITQKLKYCLRFTNNIIKKTLCKYNQIGGNDMNYENASVLSNQNIVLKDRKKLEISGIKKIESLNSEEFLIDTKLGLLFIKGQDLEMQMLDIDKGNIWISGLITVIEYVETSEKKEKTSFFKKVFK